MAKERTPDELQYRGTVNRIAWAMLIFEALFSAVGVLIAVISLVIVAMRDDTIHDEDYVLQNYDYPILAKVPNLLNAGGKHYGYYYQDHSRSRGKSKD